ncbi:hypothetical protein LSTR_LSTR005170 [Laodelphax striatellus]|uniref:Uncharacterized protein n=1 Tax=Laodelphax striatellus TaxID=195883 RepID=A0A482XMP9_LAOST|nr:hypothetical protein LSTR_LSTR005170 [Laodelphax striatellus]
MSMQRVDPALPIPLEVANTQFPPDHKPIIGDHPSDVTKSEKHLSDVIKNEEDLRSDATKSEEDHSSDVTKSDEDHSNEVTNKRLLFSASSNGPAVFLSPPTEVASMYSNATGFPSVGVTGPGFLQWSFTCWSDSVFGSRSAVASPAPKRRPLRSRCLRTKVSGSGAYF